MRIGILTGGGDVPGLNACIKALVHRIVDEGHEALGIRRGWEGLVYFDPDDDAASREACLLPLDKQLVRTVDRTEGTFLHTSRCNPGRCELSLVPRFLEGRGVVVDEGHVDLTAHVTRVLAHLGIDALVPVGGDDTLGYAARVHREGFPIVSIPKTMDNDVFGTDYCLGFSTAITRAVALIHQLRTTFGSHERVGIVELFGRHSGQTALVTGYIAGADRTVICEVPFDLRDLAGLLARDKADNPSRYAVLAISEGASEIGGEPIQSDGLDPFGHPKLGGIGAVVCHELEEQLGLQTMVQRLGYLMRSGPPDALDVMVAVNYANLAVDLVFARDFGRMVALEQGRYTHVSATAPVEGARHVDVEALYDRAAYRPRVRRVLDTPMFLY